MESQELLGLFSFEEEHQLPAATLNYFPFCLSFSFLSNYPPVSHLDVVADDTGNGSGVK